MPSLLTPIEYLRAMQVAARGKPSRYLGACSSVLRARIRYGIGPRLHSLFGLIDVPSERWGDYLLDERLRVVLRRINPPEAREIVNDKLAFHDHCVAHGLATIPIRCLVSSRLPDGASSTPHVASEGAFADALHPDDARLFFKLVNGTWGMDAFSASRTDRGWRYEGNTGTTADLFAFAMARLGGRRGWIVQPLVESSAKVREITSKALSTIRVISALTDGVPTILFANLRISVSDNATDNFAHGTSGNLVAPVDLASGALGIARGSSNRHWPEMADVARYPDTGNPIAGFMLPHWLESKELCERAHRTMSGLRILAWDLALTESGPVIVEANATFDVSGIQVGHGRGIRDALEEIIS